MLNCSSATTRLNALHLLNEQFQASLKLAQTGAKTPAEARAALERAKQLKAELETGIQELSGELFIEVIVSEAINPYAEALKEAGLPDDHPECAEKKEVRFNLEEIIRSQCDRYTAQGMTEWVIDIHNNHALLETHLSPPEEMKKIEARIQEGMVPVVMPSRAVQQATWQKAFEQLKPFWVDNGTEKSLISPYTYEKYPEKMTPPPNPDGTTPTTFFDSLPDRPYLVWTKPTAEPMSETTNLTYEEQKTKLAALHSENPNLVDAIDLTPLEYAALQSIHTAEVKRQALARGLDSSAINSITPLDKAGYTRFLFTGLFSDGNVPRAYFSPGGSRLRFDGVDVDANSEGGFRPAARS